MPRSPIMLNGTPVNGLSLSTLKVSDKLFVPNDAYRREQVRGMCGRLGLKVSICTGPYVGYFTVYFKKPKPEKTARQRRSSEEMDKIRANQTRKQERWAWHRAQRAKAAAAVMPYSIFD